MPTHDRSTRRSPELEALDAPAKKIGKAVRGVIKPGPVKNALSGSWLGHALHPLLTDVTIGSFTSAVALDWLGGDESEPAAQRLIGLGLLSALPTVTSGYSDWADTEVANEPVRRIGIVHAASNFTAASLFAASWLARRRGDHGRGRALALAGGRRLAGAAYLGAHLTLAEGVGVDHTAFEDGPEDWTVRARRRRARRRPDALRRGRRHGGDARPQPAAPCTRCRTTARTAAARCTRATLDGVNVSCPWHDSVFDLRDGALIHGPAAYPQPAWDTRVNDGRIEVRRR